MRQRSPQQRLLSAVLLLLLLCLPLSGAGAEAEAGDITGECSFLSSNKRATLESLIDDSEKTKLSLGAGEWIGLQWPGDMPAQGLYLVWESVPSEYIIEQRNSAGSTISTAVFYGGTPQEYLPLDAQCRMVLLLSRGKGTLTDTCLCRAEAEIPARVHDWRQPAERSDLMLVAAKPGDELSVFPGVLAAYAVERALPCTLVYLSRGSDASLNAALNALWEAGVREKPVIGAYGAQGGDILAELEGGTGGDKAEYAIGYIVEQLRRFQPEVLVSHAEGGEDGDAMRAETYRAVRQAAALAANAEMFPDSLNAYGLWQVSKLYLHGFEATSAAIDGVGYGLVSSTVGVDTGLDDLFENIPESAYAGYVPPEATPTPVITPTPYTPPTPSPAPTEAPDTVKVQRMSTLAWLLLCGLLLIILVLVVILAVRVIREWRITGVPRGRKRRRKKKRREDFRDE